MVDRQMDTWRETKTGGDENGGQRDGHMERDKDWEGREWWTGRWTHGERQRLGGMRMVDREMDTWRETKTGRDENGGQADGHMERDKDWGG